MDIETALVAFLDAQTAITAIVGSGTSARIYPAVGPEGAQLPFLTYLRVSGPRIATKDGPSSLAYPRFQFDCWGTSYAQARGLATAVRTALDGFKGTMGSGPGVQVDFVSVVNDRDMGFDQGTLEYRWTVDAVIWHVEQ